MKRKFTKYPSNYVRASKGRRQPPYGFDKEYEMSRLYGGTANLSFDFIAPNGVDEAVIRDIIDDAFMGYEVNNVDFRSVDYPNWQADYASAPRQIGVAFTYDVDVGYDDEAILDDLCDQMRAYGYEIIGNPEFYG